MVDRLAIKRLSASDCTLFEGVFRTINKGNQKGINLNADVLTGELYPGLPIAAAATNNEIALAIVIYGPDAKSAHKVSRKIIKNATYKNWRLNGEFIPGPPGDTSRYDAIKPGDLAIMAFKGELSPTGMDLIIISQTDPADAALHPVLTALFANRSMIVVTPVQIGEAANRAAVPDTHPIYTVVADPAQESALEDAAQGGIQGIGKLLTNKGGQKLSAMDLAKAKARAEYIGQDGEGLVNGYLASSVAAGQLASFKWVSAENAISPFDFDTHAVGGQQTLIDVKTTNGPFENVIHISLAEIIQAAGPVPYCIYRVFDLNEDGGKLRISDSIQPLARQLKTSHENHMPQGIRVDSFSVSTATLTWGPEQYIERPDEETS